MMLSIPDKAKVNVNCYIKTLLPRLIEERKSLLPSGFIFQQDTAPAHIAKLAQDWIATNCSEFVGKYEWPPKWPDISPLYCHIWEVMVEHTFHPKPKNIAGLKKVLQLVWNQPPQDCVNNKAMLRFTKRLRAYVKASMDILNMLCDELFNDTEH